MAVIMILVESATTGPLPPNTYLADFDPEAFDGRGRIQTTTARMMAKRFPDLEAAVATWKRSPRCHPIRLTDGRPNRPLSAYTVIFETV